MDAFDLDAFRQEHRLVLVFAPSERAPAFEKQMDLLRADGTGLQAREVLIATVLVSGRSEAGDRAIGEADAIALRERFGIGREDFAVVLVDGDGQVVRKDDAPLQPASILEQVDGLPARDREQRSKAP